MIELRWLVEPGIDTTEFNGAKLVHKPEKRTLQYRVFRVSISDSFLKIHGKNVLTEGLWSDWQDVPDWTGEYSVKVAKHRNAKITNVSPTYIETTLHPNLADEQVEELLNTSFAEMMQSDAVPYVPLTDEEKTKIPKLTREQDRKAERPACEQSESADVQSDENNNESSDKTKRFEVFRRRSAIVKAARWFKNGDHPHDDCVWEPSELFSSHAFLSEGKVVRAHYRDPGLRSRNYCDDCGRTLNTHGFIENPRNGHRVCPGDWIITLEDGETYPCKPDVFERHYEKLED